MNNNAEGNPLPTDAGWKNDARVPLKTVRHNHANNRLGELQTGFDTFLCR
jgi:hypothetical protein